MDRIGAVKDYVNGMLAGLPDADWQKWGYTHLYGVAQFCAMIAMRRGGNVELATVAGLLHDVATYRTMDGTQHARRGAVMAREILSETGLFAETEMDAVCAAISHHSDKAGTHAALDEVLKDADVLQHALFDPLERVAEKEAARYEALKREFALNG